MILSVLLSIYSIRKWTWEVKSLPDHDKKNFSSTGIRDQNVFEVTEGKGRSQGAVYAIHYRWAGFDSFVAERYGRQAPGVKHLTPSSRLCPTK